MGIHRSAFLPLAILLGCDTAVEVAETPPPTPGALPASAVAPEQSAYLATGRVDLQAVVDGVADGSIKSAAELETKLSSKVYADIDLDADGERDELRIVERRKDKATVFEIRALPSAKAKADAELEIEAAPVVAELRVEAHADLGNAVAHASFTESFVASAKLEANVTVEHTFTGVKLDADGQMHVEAHANAFVVWTFRPRRPLFVAEVFVVVHTRDPEPDPCWPPGHCKHGFWKATGDDHRGKHDGESGRVVIAVDVDHHDARGHGHDTAKHHDAPGPGKGGKPSKGGKSDKGGKGKGGKGK